MISKLTKLDLLKLLIEWWDSTSLTDCNLTRVMKMWLSKCRHEVPLRAHLQNWGLQLCRRAMCLSNTLPLKVVKERPLKTLRSTVWAGTREKHIPKKDTCSTCTALKLAAMYWFVKRGHGGGHRHCETIFFMISPVLPEDVQLGRCKFQKDPPARFC